MANQSKKRNLSARLRAAMGDLMPATTGTVGFSVMPQLHLGRDNELSLGDHLIAALMHAMTPLTATIPVGVLEIPALVIEPCESVTSAIKARLISPYACALATTRIPARVHADRPLEIAVRLGAGAGVAASIASCISAHARVTISVAVSGQPRAQVSVPVSARPSDGGWIIRALIRPAAWAEAASVTLVSLSLAGRPLPCDCLPATLRVGYNHALAPEGAVFAAARAGDVAALQTALDAGGSTEEADEVRGGANQAGLYQVLPPLRSPLLSPSPLQSGRTASHSAASNCHLESLRMLLAAGANPAAVNEVRGSIGPCEGGLGGAGGRVKRGGPSFLLLHAAQVHAARTAPCTLAPRLSSVRAAPLGPLPSHSRVPIPPQSAHSRVPILSLPAAPSAPPLFFYPFLPPLLPAPAGWHDPSACGGLL